MKVRPEEKDDFRRVREVETAAFGGELQARIVERLRLEAEPVLSLVAEVEDDIVGHIMFSPVIVSDHPNSSAAQLSPLAVDPSYQGKGVGSALVREGLAQCQATGWHLVFLLGDPRYYSRFGFIPAGPAGFTYQDGRLDADLQVYEVTPGTMKGKAGPIHFHRVFEEVGSSG